MINGSWDYSVRVYKYTNKRRKQFKRAFSLMGYNGFCLYAIG